MAEVGGNPPEAIPGEPSRPVVYGGRYALESEVGHGGMGRVYRARDLKLGRDVALKVLAPGSAQDERRRARFEQEARAAGSLNDPNILDVHDVGEHDGEPYIVSELLEGETLRGALSRGPLAPGRVLELAMQLASGLAAAHRKGIVHRDLKPDNLFVTSGGHVKILDFGIAKLIGPVAENGHRTDSGAVMGTPAYMSPEQVRGEPAGARSDVFACGVVLHEMLSGAPPFLRATSLDTASAILHDAPAPLPGSALTQVIARCLEKDAGARYGDGAALLEDLEAIARGARTAAGKRLRRRVTLVAAAALAGTLALAWLGYRRWSQRELPRTRVAVADFTNETDDKDLSGLSGMLMTSLEQSKRLSVLTRSTMYALLDAKVERIDETAARELAKRTQVDALVLASIRRFGEVYAIDAKVLDPGRDVYLVAVKEQARGKEEVPALIDRVSERLRIGLHEPEAEVRAASMPVAHSTSANLEAYRHLFAGEQSWLRDMDGEKATVEFRTALALDPGFTLAHLRLAEVEFALEVTQDAERVDIAQVMQHADRLSPRDLCTARALNSFMQYRAADALARYKECAAKYPDEWTMEKAADLSFHLGDLDAAEAYFEKKRPTGQRDVEADTHLAQIWTERGQFDRLLADTKERVRAMHDADSYRNLAQAQAAAGDLRAAEQTVEEAYRLFPKALPFLPVRLAIYAGDGDRMEALWPAAEKRASFPPRYARWVRIGCDVLRGRYRKAFAALDAESPDASGGWAPFRDEREFRRDVLLFFKLNILGLADPAAARKLIGEIEALGPSRQDLFAILVTFGDDANLLPDLVRTHDVPAIWARAPVDALLAAAAARREGRVRDEIAALERVGRLRTVQGDVLRVHQRLGRLYLQTGEARKAIDVLRPAFGMQPPPFGGELTVHGFHDLGVAYEMSGDKAKALDYYGRVLRMWSDADADIPDLIDTKARYAALTR